MADLPPAPGPGWRRIALAALPREPWRNGAGWTRPVAAAQHDGRLDWRVSIAEIDRAARFSAFPGLDRTAVLARGGPVLLRAPEQQWPLQRPGDLARFPGEWALDNAPPQTAALIWNVMVARDRVHAEVTVHHDAAVALPATGTVLLWVMHGSARAVLPDGGELAALDCDEGLLGDADRTGLTLVPASPGTAMVLTRLAGCTDPA